MQAIEMTKREYEIFLQRYQANLMCLQLGRHYKEVAEKNGMNITLEQSLERPDEIKLSFLMISQYGSYILTLIFDKKDAYEVNRRVTITEDLLQMVYIKDLVKAYSIGGVLTPEGAKAGMKPFPGISTFPGVMMVESGRAEIGGMIYLNERYQDGFIDRTTMDGEDVIKAVWTLLWEAAITLRDNHPVRYYPLLNRKPGKLDLDDCVIIYMNNNPIVSTDMAIQQWLSPVSMNMEYAKECKESYVKNRMADTPEEVEKIMNPPQEMVVKYH